MRFGRGAERHGLPVPPLGATGAIRSATAIHALQRNQLKYAMVTMCVGMGQGAAGIFERV